MVKKHGGVTHKINVVNEAYGIKKERSLPPRPSDRSTKTKQIGILSRENKKEQC